MSIYDFDKSRLDNSLIDLYLNHGYYALYPTIPATIFSSTLTDNSAISDYITQSDSRTIPITPLRCAWEMGDKWSQYIHDIKLKPGEGGGSACKYENFAESLTNPRVHVSGIDGEHYETPCNGAESRGMRDRIRKGGYDTNGEPNESQLPPALISYRGWAGCTGWHGGWRDNNWSHSQSGPSDCSQTEIFSPEVEKPCMKHGHFFMGVSNVCDTGDFFPISSNGSQTSGCNQTCGNMSAAMANMWSCFGGSRHNGAVGWIGPTDLDTDTRFNNLIQSLTIDAIIQDGYREMGDVFDRGKSQLPWGMAGVNCQCEDPDCDYSSIADFFYAMVYVYAGDPSLPIWTGRPSKIVSDLDNNIIPSEWGRFKQRPRINDGTPLSDEIPWSISASSSNKTILIKPYPEEGGAMLIDSMVTIVYEIQPPYPLDQQYFYSSSEFFEESEDHPINYIDWSYGDGFQPQGPAGRKNWVPYLLKSGYVPAGGLSIGGDLDDPQFWIEGTDEIGALQVGTYFKLYINTETRRHGKPYEQREYVFRITE